MLIISKKMDIGQLAARMAKPRGGWPAWKITGADAILLHKLLIEEERAGEDFDSFSDEEWQEFVGDAVVRELSIGISMSAWAAVLSGLSSAQKNIEGGMEFERITCALEKIADELEALEERNGEQSVPHGETAAATDQSHVTPRVLDHANELANEEAKGVETHLRLMETADDDVYVQLAAYNTGYVEGYLRASKEKK